MSIVNAIWPLWAVHTVTVTPAAGSGAYGDTFGEAYTVTGFLDRSRKSTTDDTGSDVTTEAVLMLPPDAAEIPAGSTVAAGNWSGTVTGWALNDAPGLPVPAHAEVSIGGR